MFTLKFMQIADAGNQVETCISCPHYEVLTHPDDSLTITTYPTMLMIDGVERKLRKEHPADKPLSYDICYVENEDGKTIGKYTAHQIH